MNHQAIILNGPSSSGKSTLTKALREHIIKTKNEDFGVISIDDFLQMNTSEAIYEDDVFAISGSLCEKAVDVLKEKPGIIIDHVITSSRIFEQLCEALEDCRIITVNVACPIEVLREREKARGNRCVGSAEASVEYLFPKDGYDITVNTAESSKEECVEKICALLKG